MEGNTKMQDYWLKQWIQDEKHYFPNLRREKYYFLTIIIDCNYSNVFSFLIGIFDATSKSAFKYYLRKNKHKRYNSICYQNLGTQVLT